MLQANDRVVVFERDAVAADAERRVDEAAS
jgi:hypothetical protein